MSNYFSFFTKVGGKKPITINKNNKQKPPCPFCDYEKLSKGQEVVKDMGESLLVVNLYPTISNTLQTVFIETKECHASFLTYDKETVTMVMKNFFDGYQLLRERHPDKQVFGVKNAGEFSSGSIHHQHMQLIVLDSPLEKRKPQIFEGSSVLEDASIIINFSEKPVTEFYEMNLSIDNKDLFAYGEVFDRFCLYLQACIQFALSSITETDSYNLAFYFEEEKLFIKVLPRIVKKSVVHTAFLLAFDMHFVPDDLEDYQKALAEKLKNIQ